MGNSFTRSSPPKMQPSRDPLLSSPSMDAGEMCHERDSVEQIKPSKRVKSWESISPGHNGSTSSSPPTMEPSQPSPVDSVHPSFPMDAREMYYEIDTVEPIRPSKRVKTSESTNPIHHGSTSSSPSTMEPSQPSPLDSVSTSPSMDAREIHDNIDPEEQIKPTKRFKSEHSQPSPVDSVHPSPPKDVIASIAEIYNLDPVEQIDPLINFVENHLKKMKNPSETELSSSDGWLETVQNGTKLAAKAIDTICTEAEKLSDSDAMRNVTLKVLEGVEDLHWAFIGLSVAAYAVENYLSVGSTEKECREILLNILELAKDVNERSKRMSYEREKLRNAVGTIVEGAVIFCDYLKRRNICRFWSLTTAAAKLKKTNQQLRDAGDSLALSSLQQLLDFQWRKDYRGDKDVFLSHSGTQKNFVRQLHRDLTREHVSCFFDEDHNSLPLAQRFPPLIFKAAETCKIAILVLSKEFVSSKWPMLELSAFISAMNSKKNPNLKLLPIFFKITPNELSHITKDSIEWENLRVSNATRDKWHVALKFVRSINGLLFSEGGDEVQLRDNVVKEICCLLKRINPLQLLDFEPVGIEEQVREVKALLKMEGTQPALAVIVYGFGGVGKSTVAASVVQSLQWSSTDFKFCRVAIDEKTPNKTSHIVELQKYIIYKLQGVKLHFQDPLEGRIEIKKTLEKTSSLLFIDNVVDKEYIRDLLPQDLQSDEQETKLRIIITSREKNVKAELNIICNEYEVKGLSDADSKRLLMNTIVQSQMIDEDEKNMINEVAVACRGVPLLLSVFGKHLRVERKKDSYQEALDALRKGNLDSYRDEDLSTKLMFVYDKIKDMEVKEAFLDICTYFHGWEWSLVADIVDFLKLEELQRRTLVSKGGSGEVIVHDILRLMSMKEARRTRFSNYKELSAALEDNLDSFGNVKGISVVSDSDNCSIKITQLEAMRQSLRVLMLGDWVTLDGSLSHKAFKNLRYLRLGHISAFPFKDPSNLDNLRVLVNRSKPGMNLSHLPSNLKHISHEVSEVECDKFARLPLQNLRSLKSFIVKNGKSVELPEELHLPVSLVELHLCECKNLPKDISHLHSLESLILDGSYLECLPEGYGKLKKLKYLSMNCCSKLASLSEELGMLSSLEALSMKYCGNFRILPRSLGALHSLHTLELRGCINLQLLPESFGELGIRSLKLHSLVNLQELPNSFGNMHLLKDLSLVSCDSLMSLPNSFVQLKMLETFHIHHCTKLSLLPEDFGRLSHLKDICVTNCHLFKELPHGFGALSALKTFSLGYCDSFVNLPGDLTELTCLEELTLWNLPLISRIPDGCGKLKKLRFLNLEYCLQLKTLPDDLENMATLEELSICYCPELEGSTMEKILNLQNCNTADIEGSKELVEKWKQMQSEIKHPIAVFCGLELEDEENKERVIRLALLLGKCMEVNTATHQLMDRSWLFAGSEEGTPATVALIMLPIPTQSHQHEILQRFVEMTREKVKNNGSGKLQIVCVRKYGWTAQRTTPAEEEEGAEEEGIRQILLSLPKGSCAIPSSQSKRAKILSALFGRYTDGNEFILDFVTGDVVVDMEGSKRFQNLKFISEDEMTTSNKPKNKHSQCQTFVKSICGADEDEDEDVRGTDEQSQNQCQSVVGQSKRREFIEALKGDGIHELLTDNNTSKVMVDDLDGKTIGFIGGGFTDLKCIKLQYIYKELQQKDSNFIAIWIPTKGSKDYGSGEYARLTQCMPWATFPQPVNFGRINPCFVLLDEHGEIAERDALPLLLAWGVESYPFTQHIIPESFCSMESESCLEFLLHGMNIVGRKSMKSKMTFLFAYHPRDWHEMKCQLEQLTQRFHGNFEVLYVGEFNEPGMYDLENTKQEYEDAVQYMSWPALSFSDMIMFWSRCKCLRWKRGQESKKEWNRMIESVHGLARHLHDNLRSLVLVDSDGAVTCVGEDELQMICEPSDEIWDGAGMEMRVVKDELVLSLSRGECSPIVKTFFSYEIDNHPKHRQHSISYSVWSRSGYINGYYICNVCFSWRLWSRKRSYRCNECGWRMCGSCWMAWAKQHVRGTDTLWELLHDVWELLDGVPQTASDYCQR